MKKKIRNAAVVSVMILAAATGSVQAYLTDADQARNILNVSDIETKINETYDPPDKPVPGITIKKSPKIQNQSKISCYVRVRAAFTNDALSFCEPLNINSGWSLKEDGYYYWDKVLLPGESTGTLFDSVTIKKTVRQDELCPFDIIVYSEAAQAKGKTPQEAWTELDT